MNNRGYKVKPRGTEQIRKVAHGFKDVLGIKKDYFPIVEMLELLSQKEIFDFEIIAKEDMPNEYGLSYPNKGLIRIREDIYDKAVDGDGFGRYTIAHEIGHFMLHKGEMPYAREVGGEHKTYEDSEWQANKFAQELLIDTRNIDKNISVSEIEIKYGVTRKASRVAMKALRRDGVLKKHLSKKRGL